MSVQLKDVLHLYLGGKFRYRFVDYEPGEWHVWCDLNGQRLHNVLNDASIDGIQIQARPLSSITEEEMKEVFRYGIGVYCDAPIEEIKRTAVNEFYIRNGKAEYIIGYHTAYDNDVRVTQGHTFYINRYYISERLSVSGGELVSTDEHLTPLMNLTDLVTCQNQTNIFLYMVKKGFDLFGLIESGQAIDATTIDNQNK